jgi:hypothetical protein
VHSREPAKREHTWRKSETLKLKIAVGLPHEEPGNPRKSLANVGHMVHHRASAPLLTRQLNESLSSPERQAPSQQPYELRSPVAYLTERWISGKRAMPCSDCKSLELKCPSGPTSKTKSNRPPGDVIRSACDLMFLFPIRFVVEIPKKILR